MSGQLLTETDVVAFCREIKSCGECQLSRFCSPCNSKQGSFFCTSKVDSITSCRNASNICISPWPWWVYLCIALIILIILGILFILFYKCCTCLFVRVSEVELQRIKLTEMNFISKFLRPLSTSNDTKDLSSLGKWAIVTGASDGIGKAIAKELLNENLSLILIGRNKEKLKKVVSEFEEELHSGSKQEIRYFIMDFTNPYCYRDFKEYLKTIDDIAVLVNNVGISYPFAQYFEEVSDELLNELIEVNVRSVILMTHMIYKKLKEKKCGAILCIGSGSSQIQSDPLYSVYAATKGVAESLCRSLQSECISEGITVQCHIPMLVTTKLSKVKKESFFVISPKKMAVESIKKLRKGASLYSTSCPYFGHWIQLKLVSESKCHHEKNH
ncbi:hypothetical protein FG386_003530 [Cryptosporidium ryanae]|uniref:uncharacterized protein n=1 Tax=Cryptosporidium ryanae TaxID=515981 RepID=UPI00351A111E|nr:hypothetical protein FG386_003530 [Cryptosporidium ryanae]